MFSAQSALFGLEMRSFRFSGAACNFSTDATVAEIAILTALESLDQNTFGFPCGIRWSGAKAS